MGVMIQPNKLQAALALASQGFKIIQLHSPTANGCTCGTDCGKSAGKHPIANRWSEHATDDIEEIKTLWGNRPHLNIGVPMGTANGIFALDVDMPGGMETLREWIAEYGELPATVQLQTGGGGIQLWYRIPDGMTIPNSVKKIGIDVDLRGEGGQSVAPGSLHQSGKLYEWSHGRSPQDIQPAAPPSWLLKKIERIAKDQQQAKLQGVRWDENISLDPNKEIDMNRIKAFSEKSSAFRDITHGKRPYVSASERDIALANILAVNGWEGQDIADFLLFYRKFQGENLKHPTYYQLTIGKAQQWAEQQRDKEAREGAQMPQIFEEEEIIQIPIPEKIKASEFPLQIFPDPLKQFLQVVSKGLQVPPDYIGLHMLAILGSVIGNSRELEIKRGWRQKPNLYCCLIADTGSGKSPALSKAFEPIKSLQKEAEGIYQLKKAQYEEEFLKYEREMKIWKDQKRDMEELPEEPTVPTREEYYVSSTTIEALLLVLEKNPRGSLVKMDELTAWIKSMGQYKGGKGDDKEHYLSMWSGEDIKINRVKDGGDAKFIPSPFLGVTGNIPPDCLSDLEGAREDGFVDRILFSYPEDQKAGAWTWDDIPQGVADLYERFVHTLRGLQYADEPEVVQFSDKARELWANWYNEHSAEMNAADFNPRFRGPWAKMPNQLARLALIMHLSRFIVGETQKELEMDETSLLCGLELLNYFKAHAKKVYAKLGQTPADARVLEAIDWIKRRGGTVTKRDAQKSNLAKCKKVSEIKALFEELQEYGYGKVIRTQTGGRGRPSEAFQLFENN